VPEELDFSSRSLITAFAVVRTLLNAVKEKIFQQIAALDKYFSVRRMRDV
jgi:hypothetical protein